MKKTITLLSLFLVGTLVSVSCKDAVAENKAAQQAQGDKAEEGTPVLVFDRYEHDFGNVTQGVPKQTAFTFTNTGDAPLVITDAKSTCGCTVPQYPKNVPIAPGESGELTVKFNGTGRNQVIKTVTLTTNTQNVTEQLRIRAFVLPMGGAQNQVPVQQNAAPVQ